MAADYKSDLNELEQIMDRHGVSKVISMLSEISYEKASHVSEAWQDRALERAWEKLGAKFDKLSTTIDDPYFP